MNEDKLLPQVLTADGYIKTTLLSDERHVFITNDLSIAAYNTVQAFPLVLERPIRVGGVPALSQVAYVCIRDVFVAVNCNDGGRGALTAELIYIDVQRRYHSLGIIDGVGTLEYVVGLSLPGIRLVANSPLTSAHNRNCGEIAIRVLSTAAPTGGVISAEIIVNIEVLYVSAN